MLRDRIWFAAFYCLYLIVPLSLPHHALAPELTLRKRERAKLYAWSEVFTFAGIIVCAISPGLINRAVGAHAWLPPSTTHPPPTTDRTSAAHP
jgi:Na+/melibiose symporter-like transporter